MKANLVFGRLPWLCLLLAVSGLVVMQPQLLTAQRATVSKRRLLDHPPAPYPSLARSMGLQGTAKVEALVAADGSVKAVEIKGGHPVLAQAAANAVHQWRWEPAPSE